MANAYRAIAGKYVAYLPPHNAGTHPSDTFDVRWRAVRISSVTDQAHVILEIITWPAGVRTVTLLNAGTAVAKRTAHGQTNVWRPY